MTKNELCTSCGMPIGMHAPACVWHDRVVCGPCHRRLSDRHKRHSRKRWVFAGAGAMALTAFAAGGFAYLKVHGGL